MIKKLSSGDVLVRRDKVCVVLGPATNPDPYLENFQYKIFFIENGVCRIDDITWIGDEDDYFHVNS